MSLGVGHARSSSELSAELSQLSDVSEGQLEQILCSESRFVLGDDGPPASPGSPAPAAAAAPPPSPLRLLAEEREKSRSLEERLEEQRRELREGEARTGESLAQWNARLSALQDQLLTAQKDLLLAKEREVLLAEHRERERGVLLEQLSAAQSQLSAAQRELEAKTAVAARAAEEIGELRLTGQLATAVDGGERTKLQLALAAEQERSATLSRETGELRSAVAAKTARGEELEAELARLRERLARSDAELLFSRREKGQERLSEISSISSGHPRSAVLLGQSARAVPTRATALDSAWTRVAEREAERQPPAVNPPVPNSALAARSRPTRQTRPSTAPQTVPQPASQPVREKTLREIEVGELQARISELTTRRRGFEEEFVRLTQANLKSTVLLVRRRETEEELLRLGKLIATLQSQLAVLRLDAG